MEWNNFFSIYSLIYLPLILSVFISNTKAQKGTIFFWIVVLSLFRGLRWDLGTDWYWYERSFNELDFSNYYDYVTQDDGMTFKRLEMGWALFMVICKKLFGTYTSFLIASNFVILVLYYKISSFFTNKPIICFVSIVVSANFFPVRQDLAVAVFFLGFCYLVQNKIKLFSLYNVLGYFFHQSAIVLLPISLLLQRFFFKYKVVVCLMIAAFVFGEYMIPFLMNFFISHVGGSIGSVIVGYYYEYSHNIYLSNNNFTNPIFPFLLNICFYSIFYRSYKKMQVSNNANSLYAFRIRIYKLMINAFIIYALIQTVFLRTIESLARIGSYFSIAQYVLLAMIISTERDKNKRIIYTCILVIYLFYRYYKHFGFFPEEHFPYHSIFD